MSEEKAVYKYDSSIASEWGFDTRQIHAGLNIDSDFGARNLPIYETTSFVFRDAQHAADRFALADPGPVYTRITNPTVEAVETRLASLEGGVAAVLFSSGQAATATAIQTIGQAGSHIVVSHRLYGGTETLLGHTLPKYGISVTFVENPDDLDEWESAVQPNTVAFFGESISNPLNDVLDIPAVADIAHRHSVPLIIDNTISTPYLQQAFDLGADVIVASTTKFLTGNSSALGGVLVDKGTFDWSVERDGKPIFPSFVEPDPAYHGIRYVDLGAPALALKARVTLLRDLGSAPSPFNAWLLAQGLDTLSLRVDRHVANAQKVAEFLDGHESVIKVNYSGLPDSPWYDIAQRLTPRGPGSIISFDIKGGKDAAWAFIDGLKLHSNLANIGDVRSLVIHPSSTTHSQQSEESKAAVGVNDSTVRLSVGIENVEDIIDDLRRGFVATEKAQ